MNAASWVWKEGCKYYIPKFRHICLKWPMIQAIGIRLNILHDCIGILFIHNLFRDK